MEDQNRVAAEIIGRLLDMAERHIAELAAQKTALEILSESWPGDEPIDWQLLVDSERQDIAQSVSDHFRVIRAALLEELERNPQQLPENWEEAVRRLIDSAEEME